MSKKAPRLSKQDSHRLDEIASIVLSADNPTLALQELESSLNGEYNQALKALRNFIEGNLHTGNDGSLMSLLVKLTNSGKQLPARYIIQYSVLNNAQNKLYDFSRQNWGTMLYFLFMTLVYTIVMIIFREKVLPAFDDFFGSLGAEVPPFTQLVMMDGGFEIVSWVVLIIGFIYYCVLPFLFRRELCGLRVMPRYMIFFLPTALISKNLYHNYLWLVYAQIYQQAGEKNPLQLAKDELPKDIKINENDWALLQIAYRHNTLSELAKKMENKLLKKLETTIKSTESIIHFLLFLLFGWMMGVPILAMYLPIFQMGNIVS